MLKYLQVTASPIVFVKCWCQFRHSLSTNIGSWHFVYICSTVCLLVKDTYLPNPHLYMEKVIKGIFIIVYNKNQDTYHERFIALKFFFTHRVEKYLFPSPIPAIILHHQRWKNRTFVYNNYIQTPNIIHGSIYMHIVFQNINVS